MSTVQNSIYNNNNNPITVSNGGTGLSNPTAGQLLLGNGSSPLSLFEVSGGQFLGGDNNGHLANLGIISNDGSLKITTTNTAFSVVASLIKASAGGTGQTSLTQNALLYGNGTDPVGMLALSAGQLLSANSSGVPTALSLTSSDSSVTITETATAINLQASTGIKYSQGVISNGTTQLPNASVGYVNTSTGNAGFLLPVTCKIGTTFVITGLSGSWTVAQNASQTIRFGTASSTQGTGGSISSTNSTDAVTLVCVNDNYDFAVIASVGNLQVV